MNTFKNFLLLAGLLVFIGSCKKDENLDLPQPVGLGGEVVSRTLIDDWLLENLTVPYNIATKYRWDPWELALNKTLTPPDESKIIPAMSAVRDVWIQPYNDETGSDLFIKRFSPKQFVLVGSVEYNFNGTVVLGQAEGGNNIAFFDINQNFDKDPVTSVRRMIQTSHHEFAHILHQNVLYPQDYRFITSNLSLPGYTATWFNITPEQALGWGYITPYSMASYDEDFVEMVANMLMEGRSRFEEIVSSTNPTAQQALRSKEQIVVTYFREVYDINFYSLQTRVQAALIDLAPPVQPVADLFGFGRTYGGIGILPGSSLTPQPAAFLDIFEDTKAGIAEADIDGDGRADNSILDSMSIDFNGANSLLLTLHLRDSLPDPDQTFTALYQFSVARDLNGVLNLTLSGYNNAGLAYLDFALPMILYFNNYNFELSWYKDFNESIFPRAQFTPVQLPGAYFYARLYP